MDEHRVPNIFQSSDVLYHYCDINTAVEFILHDKRLRLSSRRDSVDPIENLAPWITYSGPYLEDSGTIEYRAKVKIANAKQLCFCMNDESKKQTNSNPKYPFEYYGFLKPRMWDQYGNKYKGICLAFSLSALQSEARTFRGQKIKYVTYNDLRLSHASIDGHRLKDWGLEKYWEIDSKRIEENMFKKHIDYNDENEYRFISFSDSKYDYIDIKNCLSGIIISDSISQFMKEAITIFANQFKVEMLTVKWDPCGITFRTKAETEKQVASIKSLFYSNK